MPVVSSVNYTTKRIYLSAATVGAPLDTLDVYREVRARRVSTEANRAFRMMIVGGGGIVKTPGVFTQQYVQLLYGCRIVPYDTDHSLVVTRDTFTDDGVSGVGCFDRAGVAANVDIDIQVSPVEVREVATGGGGLSPTLAAQLLELVTIHGLVVGSPLVVGPTSRVAGAITQTISEAAGVVTVTRA